MNALNIIVEAGSYLNNSLSPPVNKQKEDTDKKTAGADDKEESNVQHKLPCESAKEKDDEDDEDESSVDDSDDDLAEEILNTYLWRSNF